MDQKEALTLARQYAAVVAHELRPDKIVLYGSYAKGAASDKSDIDVAVIFHDFSGDWLRVYTRLSHLRRNVSSLIEPVLLDSANDKSGFVDAVLATGEVIYQQ
jgi:predicted nucleotidyltransferase